MCCESSEGGNGIGLPLGLVCCESSDDQSNHVISYYIYQLSSHASFAFH